MDTSVSLVRRQPGEHTVSGVGVSCLRVSFGLPADTSPISPMRQMNNVVSGFCSAVAQTSFPVKVVATSVFVNSGQQEFITHPALNQIKFELGGNITSELATCQIHAQNTCSISPE